MNLRKITTALVVGSFLLAGAGCSSSSKTDSKGNDVVASVKGKNYTADYIYKNLYDSASGKSYYYQAVLQKIIDEKFPVDDDIETDADTIVEKINSSYKSQYGDDDYKKQLKSALQSSGYDDMDAYRDAMIKQLQYSNFLLAYVNKNYDKVFEDYYKKEAPRYCSIIKISVADTTAITSEEQSKIDEVKNLLGTDKSFGDIAKDYSDDTNTKNNKGSLGIVDSTTGLSSTYGEEIETSALALSKGEVSEAVTGTDGVYFIKCTSDDKAKIKKELKNTNIDSPLIAYDNYMQYKAFQSYKFKYTDKKVKKAVEKFVSEAIAEGETASDQNTTGGTE